MALINCPECGTEVSDKAEKCIKCAYPISQIKNNISSNLSNQNVNVKTGGGCFLQTLNAGCLVTAVIVIIIIILVLQ